jgi:hypothetical protein
LIARLHIMCHLGYRDGAGPIFIAAYIFKIQKLLSIYCKF